MAIAVVTTGSSNTGDLGFTATAGRIIIAAVSIRANFGTWSPSGGWSKLQEWLNTTSAEPPLFLAAKVAAGGETTVGGSFASGGRACVAMEVTGATLTGVPAGSSAEGNSATATIPSVSPPAGTEVIVLGASCATFPVASNFNSSWTTAGQAVQNGNQWPWVLLGYRIVTSASGSYSASNGWTNGGAWWAVNGGLYLPSSVVPGLKAQSIII